jgi:2-oxoglutarate dehydrogenase E1 component
MYVADCTTPANFFSLVEKKTNENNFPQTACCAYTKGLLRDRDVFLQSKILLKELFKTIDDQTVNKAEQKNTCFQTGKFYDITAEEKLAVEMMLQLEE